MISRAGGFMLWLSPHLWSFVAPDFGHGVALTPLPKPPLRLLPRRRMFWGVEGSRVASAWAGESWWRWQICREGLGPVELAGLQGWLGLGLPWEGRGGVRVR